MNAYLDTSAAAKLLTQEAESESLRTFIDGAGVELVGCDLLETELRRFARRLDLPAAAVTALLERVTQYAMPRSIYTQAALLPGRHLRSLGALHISVALRLEVDVALIYDRRMREAAVENGLRVLAPGDPRWPDD